MGSLTLLTTQRSVTSSAKYPLKVTPPPSQKKNKPWQGTWPLAAPEPQLSLLRR